MVARKTSKRLLDKSIRRALNIETLKGSKRKKIVKVLRAMERQVVAELALADTSTKAQVNALLVEIRATLKDATKRFTDELYEEIDDLIANEGRFAAKLLAGEVDPDKLKDVDVRALRAAVYGRPFNNAALRDWVSRLDSSVRKNLEGAIAQGIAEGLTVEEIAVKVRGVSDLSEKSAMALVRTAYTHVTNVAANEVFKANGDVLYGVRWVSVLDSRTTAICRSLDGQVFAAGEGPRPPAHINCRSRVVPVFEKDEEFEREDYATWLARQPQNVQDRALGKKKARLWREGKLTLDQFVEPGSSRELRIDELPI